jgi:hypothetical protein
MRQRFRVDTGLRCGSQPSGGVDAVFGRHLLTKPGKSRVVDSAFGDEGAKFVNKVGVICHAFLPPADFRAAFPWEIASA